MQNHRFVTQPAGLEPLCRPRCPHPSARYSPPSGSKCGSYRRQRLANSGNRPQNIKWGGCFTLWQAAACLRMPGFKKARSGLGADAFFIPHGLCSADHALKPLRSSHHFKDSTHQAADSSKAPTSKCAVSPQPTRAKPSGDHRSRLMAALPRCQLRGACTSSRVAAR